MILLIISCILPFQIIIPVLGFLFYGNGMVRFYECVCVFDALKTVISIVDMRVIFISVHHQSRIDAAFYFLFKSIKITKPAVIFRKFGAILDSPVFLMLFKDLHL